MWKVLRKLQRTEQGQAFAEYFVLIPGSILMVLAGFSLVRGAVKEAYCDVVDLFSSGICGETQEAGVDQDAPAVDITSTPTPTIQACIVLQEAQGCSQCDQDPSCTCLPGVNVGMYVGQEDIASFVIKAGKEYHVYQTGYTDDGCYHVTIEGDIALWEKVGGGSTCQDVSHLQTWYSPICD